MDWYGIWRKIRRWVRSMRKKLAVLIAGEDFPFLVVQNQLPEKCIRRIVVGERLSNKTYKTLDADAIKDRLIKAAHAMIAEQTTYTVKRGEKGVKCEIEFFLLKKGD